MKALQVVKPRAFVQVDAPAPLLETAGVERILVQPEWVSMCGSDIPFFTGSKRHKSYPLPVAAPIHETSGRVVASTSSLFLPGDRVVSIPENDQGLSELFVARAAKAVKLPPDLDDGGAACLIQPLATVINAVDRLGNLAGKAVAVVGLGSIGLFFCWLLRARGVRRIVGIDPLEQRCRAAAGLGADEVIPARSLEVVHAARADPRLWDPPDICIEAVGHQMDTLNDCLALIRQEGAVLAFGVPDHPVYAIEYETFFRKNATLIACVTPNWSEYLVKARDVFIAARGELEPLVTHRFSIREAERAFQMYANHEDGILKAVIELSGW